MKLLKSSLVNRHATSRRSLLKALGLSAAAAPFMPTLSGWAAPGAKAPQRLVLLFAPHGVNPEKYWPIHGPSGLLNDPLHPYWGRYEGDEDTRRKPAYHNGTAWVWLLPTFCEALALAWDGQPEAVAAARAYLGSLDGLLAEGCVGQLPEILDGDAPHAQRGCDAQAWSVTEALRVWLRLGRAAAAAGS